MNKRKINIILTIVLFILIILTIISFYKVFIEKNIYRSFDFFASQIRTAKEYSLCKNSVDNYLNLVEKDFNNIQYFFRKFEKEKQQAYSDYLSESYSSIIVNNIKKGLGNVYIVYFYRNRTSNDESRIVLKFSGDHYYVLYDSIYENFKEEK